MTVPGRALRLFFAVPILEPAARRLAEASDDLRRSRADVKWARVETLHMTLAFLGSTPDDRLEDALGAGREAVSGTRAHRASFTHLGAFPSWSRPRVVWAGLGPGAEELRALARRLHEALKRAEFTFDEKPFVPHATLGRVRGPRGLKELVARAEPWLREPAWKGADFRVDEVILFKSALKPDGPVHEALGRFPLLAAAESIR